MTHRILAPIVQEGSNTYLVCEADTTECLLAELSIQRLDLVLAAAPISASAKIKAFNHLLGECGVNFFATAAVAKKLKGRLPQNLNGVRFLSPIDGTIIRRALDQRFASASSRNFMIVPL